MEMIGALCVPLVPKKISHCFANNFGCAKIHKCFAKIQMGFSLVREIRFLRHQNIAQA
jgi:hypothetical protein